MLMVEEALAQWAASPGNILGSETRSIVERAFVDVTACAIAGAVDPSTAAVVRLCADMGSGEALALGTTARSSAPWAALIGGTAAHALDFDDNFAPATTHATAVLAPALFALASETGSTGEQLAEAYIVGIEIQARIGRFLNPGHYEAGWHATSTIGAIGGAAACSRLLGLNAEETLASLSAAASMASGSKRQFGSMMKPVHAGLAAKNSILAARMAQAGLRGDREPLIGKWSVSDLYGGSPDGRMAASQMSDGLGRELSIINDGLLQKRFPCCGAAHRTLDGLALLRAQHGVEFEAVERVDAYIPSFAHANLRYDRPTSAAEARFSLPYCGARVLEKGDLTLSDLTDRQVADPRIRDWLPRFFIHPKAGSVVEELGANAAPALTRISLKSGRVIEAEVSHVRGSNLDPLSAAEIRGKFVECCRFGGHGPKSAELYDLSSEFLETSDIRAFGQRLETLLRNVTDPAGGVS